MTKVGIPEDYVVPMEGAAPGVFGLRIAFVNVYGVADGDSSWTLVDAGLPFSASYIENWSERTLRQPPKAIVLTHGHFDHVSAARALGDKWDVPIYAHPLEFPYLTGERAYPAPDLSAGGGLMTWLSPLYPKGPVQIGDRLRPLPDEESDLLPGWAVTHTPGHTPGHISFFRPSDRTLIAGDAFCTTKPESFFEAAIAQAPELHGPPAYFTMDWQQAARSIEKLAELEPAVIVPGHGKPLSGAGVPINLRRLAEGLQRDLHHAA